MARTRPCRQHSHWRDVKLIFEQTYTTARPAVPLPPFPWGRGLATAMDELRAEFARFREETKRRPRSPTVFVRRMSHQPEMSHPASPPQASPPLCPGRYPGECTSICKNENFRVATAT
ncbi:hypothetical protein N7528_009253 [Penicillium herquei]|nr:hypothetical protein N7528_009253 [Penicillium herquei]